MLLPEATRRSLVTVITQTGGVVVVRLVWAVVLARVVVVARVGAVPAFWYLCKPCRSCETSETETSRDRIHGESLKFFRNSKCRTEGFWVE